MTNQEMVLDMLERQHKYDRAIEKAHGIQIRALGSDRLKAALLDEVGELNHAMKSRWCWWKKTQAPEDRDEVLEELADGAESRHEKPLVLVEEDPGAGGQG